MANSRYGFSPKIKKSLTLFFMLILLAMLTFGIAYGGVILGFMSVGVARPIAGLSMIPMGAAAIVFVFRFWFPLIGGWVYRKALKDDQQALISENPLFRFLLNLDSSK